MGLLQPIVGTLLSYFVARTLYNLFFHPLASYKGPLLWRAFQFPSLAAMLGGNMPYRVKELHDQYGPIVRVAPNELSIIDDRAWKDIFQRRDFLRPPQWGARPPGVDAHNLISAPADVHARFRKAFAPAFSEKETQGYETLIRLYCDKLINTLDTKGVVDLVEWLNFTTFDIIGELCWGQSFDCLESGKGHAFISVLLHFKAATIATCIKYYPAIDALIPFITPKSALTMLHNVFNTGHQRIQQRISGQTEPRQPDILSHVLQYNKVNPEAIALSQDEVEFNALTMIVAGSETITTALCGAVHYLLLNPSAYDTLASEIRSNFNSAEQISASSVTSLRYLNAVLNETLRLCPPIPDNMRRAVPKGGATVAGLGFPEGTVLGVSCWSVFQSDQHFSNPTTFAPERWLSDEKGVSHHNVKAYYPFSLGPHGCLGQPLAWLEMRLILSLLLFHFDLEAVPKAAKWNWSEQAIWWTWEKKPLLVNVKRRSF
ncbi:cytochrome P450 ClCP1 [Massarina eburnea CBS 473.64]|uniref:Cytochrome P450 ClCP1 n=1 Tax=Massarina eburnea CBS 473.64 TaxID=1395130 RepID=A0A6A6S1T7_9PLEO|nr:cytochrome P450 ClCP1 [Massarina eburnea CBS 473.64]